MQKLDLKKINALHELERIEWAYQPASNNNILCKCPNPAHQDSNPSASLTLTSNTWTCFGCGAKGDIVSFLAYVMGVQRVTVLDDLTNRYPELFEGKEIAADTIEKHHQRIWEEPQLLQALYERGITDNAIRKYRLGAFNHRIVIPYQAPSGRFTSFRLYLPGAPEKKFITTPGYADPKLFMESQIIKYDSLWMVGGEIKAIGAAEILNTKYIGAFWLLAGEGKGFQREWLPKFKGKTIFICMDIDNAGRAAAQIYAETLSSVANVFIINLPLDQTKYPKGDLSDYIGKEGADFEQLHECMRVAQPFERTLTSHALPNEVIEIELTDVFKPAYVDRRVSTEALIQARSQEIFHGPKAVKVKCARDQNAICGSCPVFSLDIDSAGFSEVEFEKCNPTYLQFPKMKDKDKLPVIRKLIGIEGCKANQVETLGKLNILEVRLQAKLKVMEDTRSSGSVKGFIVGSVIPDLGQVYKIEGGLFSNPQDQSLAFIITEYEEAEDSLSSFAPSEDEVKALTFFRPETWTDEALAAKLDELYSDLEDNVTKIYRRRHLHLVYDLCYHSPLMFSMAGKDQINGWVNAIVVGDSSQGKSETILRLMKHYGIGERVDCKNASIAGLIGGLQQLEKTWFITWGLIPANDRGLVILEEFKGLPTETISKMTDMRSSGIAELPKIEHEKTYARTRLLAISNARFDRVMAEYNYGFQAISELVGNPEDVRRFDIACIVSQDDIPDDFLHEVFNKKSETKHKATKELCRNLILFAWTRKLNQIRVQDVALTVLNDEAARLNKIFSQSFPLLDTGTTREKIARLAASLAVRTFSTESDNSTVLVRPEHIRYISKLLEEIYSADSFGFDRFSVNERERDSIAQLDSIKAMFISCQSSAAAKSNLMSLSTVAHQDVMDSFQVNRDTGFNYLSRLVACRCLQKDDNGGYRKTKAFIRFLSDPNFLRGSNGNNDARGDNSSGSSENYDPGSEQSEVDDCPF